jgi:hypothetical protein
MHTSECGGEVAANVWAECQFSMILQHMFIWRWGHLNSRPSEGGGRKRDRKRDRLSLAVWLGRSSGGQTEGVLALRLASVGYVGRAGQGRTGKRFGLGSLGVWDWSGGE